MRSRKQVLTKWITVKLKVNQKVTYNFRLDLTVMVTETAFG